MTTLKDPMGRAFIEFCRSQGIKFVDGKTGKEVFTDEEPTKEA